MVMLFHLLPLRAPGGWIGVDIFFVLSGFLITSLLLDERVMTGRVRYGRFVLRRFFRLYPGLVALLIGATIWAEIVGIPHWGTVVSWTVEVRRNIVDMSQNSNLLKDNVLGPTWTLAMEDQFYVVWPIVLIVASRFMSRRGIAGLAAAGALASLLVKCALYGNGVAVRRLIFGPDCTAGLLLIGCVAGLLFVNRDLDRLRGGVLTRFAPPCVMALLGVAFVLAQETDRWLYVGPTTVLALASAVLIVGVVLAPTTWFARLLSWGPLVLVGKWSYSLYLWHTLAYFIVSNSVARGRAGFVGVAEKLGLAFALGITSYYLIERPVRNLGRSVLARSRQEVVATVMSAD